MDNTSTEQTYYKAGYELSLEAFGTGGRLPAGHVYGPALSNAYLLQYCSEGCGELEVDGKVFPVKHGECVVTFPGQTRIERADEKDPWALTWIGLSGHSADSFFEKLGLTPDNLLITHCEQSHIPLRLREVIDIADKAGFQYDFLLGMRLFAFMEECISSKAAREEKLQTAGVADSYVAQAIYYMNMQYMKKEISVQALADHVGLNRSYFYEVFKQQTGMSPQEYLTQFRIKKACEYLRLPQATVTSVAYSVGYEPSTFCRAFKNVMGITPREYMTK